MSLFVAVSTIALTAAAQAALHSRDPQLGTVSFATSCNADASARFVRGLGWLHSFEYEQAAQSFTEAAAADPRCSIAQWGVAMSYYHPLWAPPAAAELEKGRNALAKARAAGASSEREQAYIAAIGTFYQGADRLDHRTRVLAYSEAMARLHKRYPDDHEAAIFYALSLIASGSMDSDPSYAKETEAGLILNRILAIAPNHPGVAHYLIHGFDYPELAQLALPAARRYAGIAPDSPHAMHMPSHIFVRLGLWDEAISSNRASEAASRAFARAQGLADSSSERLHAMDYLAYAYLQTGEDGKAEQILDQLNSIRRADPPIFTVAYAATAIPARLALERRRWKEAASLELQDNVRTLAPLNDFKWGEAHVRFARAVGAARSGKVDAARVEVAKLKDIEEALTVPTGSYDWRMPVAVERQVAEAWLAAAEGRAEDAARLMRAAADLDDIIEKHPVTPGAILPAREQLGDLLLELGRPREALVEYEAALKRAPGRLAGLYGAARAARLIGDKANARIYYLRIVELTKDGPEMRPEISEARAFVARVAAPGRAKPLGAELHPPRR
jgi:tetratricopeptide (TPR) repeat protein